MDVNSETLEYVLSAQLVGHDRDVRGVCAMTNGNIVTTSRDNSVRVWVKQEAEDWHSQMTLAGHTHFVGPVIQLADGSIATGGYDKMIVIWNPISGAAQLTLIGHEEAVVALAQLHTGEIVSGSWDKTIRVWRNGETVSVLRGHAQAVWGVACCENGDIWSASADKTVKIWRGGSCWKTLRESEDCVRQLRVVPQRGVAVASNDGVVRLYSFDGELLRQMHGHTSYVYCVQSIGPAHELMVSGGEDCTVRVWNGQELQQTLQLPSTVWDVDVLPNGDIVVACADWIARVFTKDPKRYAPPEVNKQFQDKLVAAAQPKENKVGDLDLDTIPGYEALAANGTREGETKVVKKPDGKGAELWKWSNGDWEKVGDVTGAVGKPKEGGAASANASGKDYNFPVDLDGRKFTISMNRGDNVFETAQNFIAENGLSEEMIDQVVEFLHANTSGSMELPSRNPDPFTGSGSLEGESRRKNPYVPQRGGHDLGELSYNPSPWADAAPVPAAAAPAKRHATSAPSHKAFPKTTYILFDTPGNLQGLVKKATEFGGNGRVLDGLVAKLNDPKQVVTDEEVRAVISMAIQFSSDKIFPAIDLLRLLALNESAAGKIDEIIWKTVVGAASSGHGPSPMLALKFLTNCVRWDILRSRLSSDLGNVLDAAADCSRSSDGKVLNALAGLVHNVSVLLSGTSAPHQELKMQAMGLVSELLDKKELAPADLFSIIASLGTLVWKDDACKALVDDLDIAGKLQNLSKTGSTPNIKGAAEEVLTYCHKMDTTQ